MTMEDWVRREAVALAGEFEGILGPETVLRYMMESVEAFQGSAVTTYIPIFARRFARERLLALAQAEGVMTKEVPEILFVCVHNAGRSQMAAVLTAALSGGRVNVRSAGSAPADEINPMAVNAMAELGLDLSQEFPKPLSDDAVRAADVVITMGCGDACPVFPGKRYLDWKVDDPAGQPLEVVRRIREDIRVRVEGLLSDLGVAPVVLSAE